MSTGRRKRKKRRRTFGVVFEDYSEVEGRIYHHQIQKEEEEEEEEEMTVRKGAKKEDTSAMFARRCFDIHHI